MTRLFAAILLALLGALSVARPATAQPALDNDKKQALRAFVDSQNMKDNWPELVRTVSSSGVTRLRQGAMDRLQSAQGLTEPDRERIRLAFEQLMPDLAVELKAAFTRVDGQALMEDLAFFVYAKHLSTPELREITAFYQSKTGMKYQRLTPTILAEAQRTGAAGLMQRYFTPAELVEIDTYGETAGARKLQSTAAVVKQESRAFFAARTEPLVEPVIQKYQARLVEIIQSQGGK